MIYTINKKIILEEVFDIVGNTVKTVSDKIKNADLNATRDKILNNAGMITGGLIGAGGMAAQMLGDNNSCPDHDCGIGAALIGAGVIGSAGAGIGHVIHNQFKKNNEQDKVGSFDNFDYKKY